MLADVGLLIRGSHAHTGPIHLVDLDGVVHDDQTWHLQSASCESGVGGSGPLRRAVRMGGGAHPWNLWYDQHGRAIVAISNAVALTLDAQAERYCTDRAGQTIYWSRVRPEDVA